MLHKHRSKAAMLVVAMIAANPAVAQTPPANASGPFVTLPERYNTVDDMALAPNGGIILAVPNFKNEALISAGAISAPVAAVIGAVAPDGTIRDYYRFKREDMHPVTGKVGPMGVEFGPDGNLYFIDRQLAYDKAYRTRVARLIVENGTPVRMEVLVEGSIAPTT